MLRTYDEGRDAMVALREEELSTADYETVRTTVLDRLPGRAARSFWRWPSLLRAASATAILLALGLGFIMKTLTLSGTPEIVAAMEAVVRKLDVAPPPEKSVEITAYLLMTSDGNPLPQSLPAQLEPVMKQLRTTFSYKYYELLDTIVLRNRIGPSGESSEEISVTGSPGLKKVPCALRYNNSQLIHDDKGDVLKLSGLRLTLGTGGFSTFLDLRVGQMVVVGKASFDASNNALIAILSAKVVD
jgi:hypothetical protein